MIKQGTPEWHKERLGLFTSSHLSDLMVKGKNSEFGDTAMSYIYKVAAERTLADEFLSGAGFEMYLERMDMTVVISLQNCIFGLLATTGTCRTIRPRRL